MLLPDCVPDGGEQGLPTLLGPLPACPLARSVGARPASQHSHDEGAFNRLSLQTLAGTRTGPRTQGACRPSPGETRTWGRQL